jgi:hypothetical protein
MKRSALAALAISMLCLAAPGVAPAQSREAELLADDWAALLALPAAENPLAGSGDPCLMVRRHVLGPVGEHASCTVEPGTRVFLWWSWECSDVEEPPSYGKTEAEQARCALAANAGVRSVTVSVDGATTEIRTPRHEVLTSQRSVDLPEDDIFGTEARTATFVAHGWALLTRPLRPGHHVLTVTTVTTTGTSESTFEVTVARAPRVQPVHRLGGLTGGELLGEQLYLLHTLPAAENPAFGNGDRCRRLGRGGRVLAPLFGVATCTLEHGRPLFVWGWWSTCGNAETPPSYAVGEAAQQACARASNQNVRALRVIVDGGAPVDIRNPRFEVVSPQRAVLLLDPNWLDAKPGPATFSAHGWAATIRGLAVGRHTIEVEVTLDGEEPFIRGPLTIDVVRHG